MRELFWLARDLNWIAWLAGFFLSVAGAGGLGEVVLLYAIAMWVGGGVAKAVGFERPGPGNAADFLDTLDGHDGGAGEGDRLRMAICIVRMGLLMAAADGEVEEAEIEAIRNFFRQHGADDEFVAFIDATILNSIQHFDHDRTIAEVNRIADQTQKEVLLLALLSVATADGHVADRELMVFFGVAAGLGFSEHQVERLLASIFGEPDGGSASDGHRSEPEWTRARALATLGLEDPCTDAHVKRAFRDLAKQYHPDKVSHLGPEFESLASERMQQINQAYAYLRA